MSKWTGYRSTNPTPQPPGSSASTVVNPQKTVNAPVGTTRSTPSASKPNLGGPTTIVKPVPVQPAPPPIQSTDVIQIKNGPQSNISAKPDIIIAMLFALIVVNGFSSGQFQGIASVITKKSTDTQTSHTSFLKIGGEIVFAIGLSIIAGISDDAHKVVVVFVLALWVLWGVQNSNHISNFVNKVK